MSNYNRENDAIMRWAATVSDGAIGLCSGARIFVDFPADVDTSTTYYVSLFHDSKVVGIGKAKTLHTIADYNDITTARKEALRLAQAWGYNTMERV